MTASLSGIVISIFGNLGIKLHIVDDFLGQGKQKDTLNISNYELCAQMNGRITERRKCVMVELFSTQTAIRILDHYTTYFYNCLLCLQPYE